MKTISQNICGANITLGCLNRNGEGRTVYGYEIILPSGYVYNNQDLKSGCQGGDEKEGMESLLSFLGAAAESYKYAERRGEDGMEGENSDLFPREIVEWAAQNSDEISMAQIELEESSN